MRQAHRCCNASNMTERGPAPLRAELHSLPTAKDASRVQEPGAQRRAERAGLKIGGMCRRSGCTEPPRSSPGG